MTADERVEWQIVGEPDWTIPVPAGIEITSAAIGLTGDTISIGPFDGPDAEQNARTLANSWVWRDGPHLEHRTITETPWERAP